MTLSHNTDWRNARPVPFNKTISAVRTSREFFFFKWKWCNGVQCAVMGRDTLCNVNTSVLVRCGACVHTEFMNAVTNAVKVQNTHPNAHAHTPLLASQHRHSAWLPPEFVTATVRVSQSARLARLCLNQCFPIRGITAVGMPSRSRNVAHLVFCLFSSDGWFIHLCQLSLNHRGVFPPTGKPLRNNGVLSKTVRRWGVVTHELFLGGLDVCYCWRNVKNVQVIGITRAVWCISFFIGSHSPTLGVLWRQNSREQDFDRNFPPELHT